MKLNTNTASRLAVLIRADIDFGGTYIDIGTTTSEQYEF